MGEGLNILVLGLGSSGVAVAHYCAERIGVDFSSVTALDTADSDRLREVAQDLETLGVTVRLGVNTVAGSYDLCVASPGIPPHAPLMRAAFSASSRTISEIQFAFERSNCPWVAITGTNGKTTTTALAAHLLTVGGMPARAVGNIGAPSIEVVAEGDDDLVLVAEVSSFQLALTDTFHPRVAVLLNITPDHLDWHGTYEDYRRDKAKVFANLGPDDTAVIDIDDLGAASVLQGVVESGARVVTVSLHPARNGAARVDDGVLQLSALSGDRVPLVPVDEILIKGPHNVSNALAASAAAHSMGVKPDSIREGLRSFLPIEHRLEPAGFAVGAEWFNDSKATNPDAVSKALTAFGDRPLILLLGGRNKGNDFGPLALEVAERARYVVLFGEACPELAEAFSQTAVPVRTVANLAEAVRAAAKVADAGDAVVLSPACASFDEFDNYEERGRTFKRMVQDLSSEAAGL
ncbi:MAG TPA: UDP-N-acetylmuramoyl-L-alanine--D-glutamate ligase [Coriobacteriia bacterium]|nr:UDP-N-acetylmuramoyl-L-alanine--D-glutamate ligase [Coriobacteriia bacterium]